MATTISATQLQELQASLTTTRQSPTTANIAATWQLLSSWGDTYATAANQVLTQPTSIFGQVTRNAWAVAGANFNASFDTVAIAHLTTYTAGIRKGIRRVIRCLLCPLRRRA